MMKVRTLLQIHGCVASCSTEDAWMERVVEMPFPPTVGMSLTDEDGAWQCVVARIGYDAKRKEYIASTGADKGIYDDLLHHGMSVEESKTRLVEKVREAIGDGWTLKSAPTHVRKALATTMQRRPNAEPNAEAES